LKKNLDFELQAIFTAYKGLKWRMRTMLVRLAWPLLCQYFSDSYAREPTIQYGRLPKIKRISK